MDLALRLSEHEASIAALRMQEDEEEAMLKAIQESVSAESDHVSPRTNYRKVEIDVQQETRTTKPCKNGKHQHGAAVNVGEDQK